ncbi:MAG: SDR family NAD(P)-dependent oxidoreductase [Dehalococcoidia bacterium]
MTTEEGRAAPAVAANGPRPPRLLQRVAVITGGNRGLGRVIGEAFAREGAYLVLASRAGDSLASTAKELEALGQPVMAVPCDVGREEDVTRLFAEVDAIHGRVDVLVNNGAISGPTRAVADLDLSDWEETLQIDLTGQFLCTREAVRRMIPRRRGAILSIGSIFGPKRPYPLRSPYAAAKAGLVALTQALAWEVGPHGIRVNAMLPGPVQGERIERVWKARADARGVPMERIRDKMIAMSAMRRLPTPEEVATLAVFLCSDEASAMTGQAINLTAGMEMR